MRNHGAFCIFAIKVLSMKNKILLLVAAFLLAGCSQLVSEQPVTETTVSVVENGSDQVTESASATEPLMPEEETGSSEERFLLTFVGDCTFGASPANYYAGVGFIKTVGEDYGYPFRNVMGWFGNDEATFLNLEGPLVDDGNPVQKKHTFRGPTSYVQILTESSVEAVTIANNHSHDYGQKGYDATVAVLKEKSLPFAERDASCIFTTGNGLKIGLYGAVYYQLDADKITEAIRDLKKGGCDLVIFAPHWGVEGTYHPTEVQTDLAHRAVDAGADIVWGSHPHVLQPVERYHGGIIYYSLGNFSFGGNGYPRDCDTALLQQEVVRDGTGNLQLGELTIVPCSVSSVEERNNYQPTPYEPDTEAYQRVLQKLNGTWTGADLPIQ